MKKICTKPCNEDQIENGLCQCFSSPTKPLLKQRKQEDLEKGQVHHNNETKPLIKKP